MYVTMCKVQLRIAASLCACKKLSETRVWLLKPVDKLEVRRRSTIWGAVGGECACGTAANL